MKQPPQHDDLGRKLVERMDWVQNVTIAELLEKYVRAGLDPSVMRITSAHIKYQTPETEEERVRLEKWQAEQAGRTEQWERETYERLRVKFEGEGGND